MGLLSSLEIGEDIEGWSAIANGSLFGPSVPHFALRSTSSLVCSCTAATPNAKLVDLLINLELDMQNNLGIDDLSSRHEDGESDVRFLMS